MVVLSECTRGSVSGQTAGFGASACVKNCLLGNLCDSVFPSTDSESLYGVRWLIQARLQPGDTAQAVLHHLSLSCAQSTRA